MRPPGSCRGQRATRRPEALHRFGGPESTHRGKSPTVADHFATPSAARQHVRGHARGCLLAESVSAAFVLILRPNVSEGVLRDFEAGCGDLIRVQAARAALRGALERVQRKRA